MSHWPCVKLNAHTASMSAIEAGQKERDETETVSAMASLSMQQPTNLTYVDIMILSSIRFFYPSIRDFERFTRSDLRFFRTTPEHSREVSEEPMEQDDAK